MKTVFDPKNCPRLVVKIGSSLLIEKNGDVRHEWMKTLVADIAERIAQGQQIIIVSSGATALGAKRMQLPGGGRENLSDAQAAAAVGQIALSGLWAKLVGEHDLTAAQLLVTLDALEDRRRYLNVTATLDKLLEAGVVPVMNENDSLVTSEIRFGDNDRLAARIGQAANADGVILLSDVDGLYDKNPGKHDDAEIVTEVHEMDDNIRAMADDGSSSGIGTGGMSSKLVAVEIASIAGIDMAIMSGLRDHPLRRLEEEERGTVFYAERSETKHKSWLGGLQQIHGELFVDEGAETAIRKGGSLLAAGLTKVRGNFERGDVVDIKSRSNVLIARGLVEYDALDTARIIGHHTSELEAVLGYSPRSAVIHRDRMVIL